MGTRRKSRELVLQMLFQADMGRQSGDDVRRTFWRERDSVEPDVRGFAEDLFRVALDRTSEIDSLIDAVIAANPEQLANYRAGKEALFGFFVGQVIKASKGKANPKIVNERLRAKLSA